MKMRYESIEFVKDCLMNTNRQGRKEIREAFSQIPPKLARSLLRAHNHLTTPALLAFLEKKGKEKRGRQRRKKTSKFLLNCLKMIAHMLLIICVAIYSGFIAIGMLHQHKTNYKLGIIISLVALFVGVIGRGIANYLIEREES